MPKPNSNWRERAYAGYVSSGQAKEIQNTRKVFDSRRPYIQSVITSHIPEDREQVIVDLGCGSGAYLYFLKQMGYTSLKGVDVSAEQVKIAHELGLTEVEQGDIQGYVNNLRDASADIILMIDLLEHMTRDEMFTILDEVVRVLKPGGRCLVHIPNAEGMFGMRVLFGDITHEQAFTPNSLAQILSLVGLHNIRSYEDKPLLYNFKGVIRRAIWEIGTLFPRLLLIAETGQTHFILSQNMLVAAEKLKVT